ncbi:MAG: response regulator transcription factor [Salinivirgaceae bacterium]|nr:response regulator transcription factor [Salinivirgaceae bacterium]
MESINKIRILLVDDEEDILEFVGYNLQKEGYEVYTANNGKLAIEKALEVVPQLIVLDVMMPEMDGIETCQELRKFDQLNNTIIAFLTARAEDYSQISGFDAGADDYITKPIKPTVLVSKVKALLRRVNGDQLAELEVSGVIRTDRLAIDKERHVVLWDGLELLLPRKEFDLLTLLASKKDRVFTREEIYSSVWGDSVIVGDRTIDVHIRKLREKLGDDAIGTIKGVGYRFNE